MFVCLGNICRSPMAEAVFRDLVEKKGLADQFEIASSGTGSWHIGERPHRGTQLILQTHHIDVGGKRAQQLNRSDIQTYDYVIAMDASNARDVERSFGRKIPLLLEFAAETPTLDVPDPYYENNFDEVYQLVLAGCRGLLKHIQQAEGK